ncbi:hypothetical protein PT015_00725 [Candidatus Mycobacterium wuenschmannii]|uniref:Uncharacterized protein n=1 Tax=Candidatus Mycobacterium wuenschmannii TaxID=3027808 RepID=A0ABY8W2T4_9MYCO|nr:hypothetical protein [Candidatus Mycobacterium wuenschmannii]WIM88089.1 hypothetical protein PT015_00725 [Candidatus Mycobacterium wuenschmannii]
MANIERIVTHGTFELDGSSGARPRPHAAVKTDQIVTAETPRRSAMSSRPKP